MGLDHQLTNPGTIAAVAYEPGEEARVDGGDCRYWEDKNVNAIHWHHGVYLPHHHPKARHLRYWAVDQYIVTSNLPSRCATTYTPWSKQLIEGSIQRSKTDTTTIMQCLFSVRHHIDLLYDLLSQEFPVLPSLMLTRPTPLLFPNKETYKEFYQRASAEFMRLTQAGDSPDVLLGSHPIGVSPAMGSLM